MDCKYCGSSFLNLLNDDEYEKEIQKGVVETHTDENGQTYTKSNSGLWFDGDGNWVKLDDVLGLFID